MRDRWARVLSATALVVAVFGSTPLGHAAVSGVDSGYGVAAQFSGQTVHVVLGNAGSSIQAIAADGTPTCVADSDTNGTITAVHSGTGLSGDATSGSATLALQESYRLPQDCTDAQVPSFDATNVKWICADVAAGGGIQSLSVSSPLESTG